MVLVPRPRVNLTRFRGVFAPNSRDHGLVTAAKRGKGIKAHNNRGQITVVANIGGNCDMTPDYLRLVTITRVIGDFPLILGTISLRAVPGRNSPFSSFAGCEVTLALRFQKEISSHSVASIL